MTNTINIIAQGFYGNRTGTSVKKDNIDRFILGYIDEDMRVTEKIDRTIIPVSNTNNIVIVYNKYQEEDAIAYKEEVFNKEGYVLKPTVIISENNVELYSRCIVCRINDDGELESLHDGDYRKFVEYLAE